MEDGAIRKSVQVTGSGAHVAAGERRAWRIVERSWRFGADIGEMVGRGTDHARPRVGMVCGGAAGGGDHDCRPQRSRQGRLVSRTRRIRGRTGAMTRKRHCGIGQTGRSAGQPATDAGGKKAHQGTRTGVATQGQSLGRGSGPFGALKKVEAVLNRAEAA